MSADKKRLQEEFWKNHISSWKKSSLGVKAYCLENGISHNTFYFWRKKLRANLPVIRPSASTAKISPFIPVGIKTDTIVPTYFQLPDAKWLGAFAAQLIRGLP